MQGYCTAFGVNDDNDDLEDRPTESTAEEIEGDNLSRFLFKIKEESKLTQTCLTNCHRDQKAFPRCCEQN